MDGMPSTKSEDRSTEIVGWRGLVGHLHYAPRAMLPMRSVDHLNLIEGVGVEGDRYANDLGHLTEIIRELGIRSKRDVSLFEQETIDALLRDHGISIGPSSHRRNITTVGVPRGHLIGRRFRVGDVIMEGSAAPPCKHMEDVIGQPVTRFLINRGGLHARLLNGGTIRVGDTIELL